MDPHTSTDRQAHANPHTNTMTDRQKDRQEDRKAGRWIDDHTDRLEDGQTYSQIDK